MNTISRYDFVRVPVPGRSYDMRGIVVGFLPEGEEAMVCVFDLTSREPVTVPLKNCTRVPRENILHGLRGLWAHDTTFGEGEICTEHHRVDQLYVCLSADCGKKSAPLPLSCVTVFGLRPA